MTFQVILYADGRIKLQYDDSQSSASPDIFGDALIGIENSDGSLGIEYRNNGAGGPMFASPLAIMFGPDLSSLPVELTTFITR